MTADPHPIECPDHGPMERLTYQGVLVRIQCRTCGNIPLDLLERAVIGRFVEEADRG